MAKGIPPEVEIAFLSTRFGHVYDSDDVVSMFRAARILDVYRVFQLAGTPRQKHLTESQWKLVKELSDD